MKDQKCYSYNGEEYYSSLQEAANRAFYECGYKNNTEALFWEADKETFNAGYFFRFNSDYLIDRAYEEVGEAAEGWDFSKEQEKNLEEELINAFDKWCDENKKHPKFFNAKNPRQIKIKFIDDDGNYEIVEPLKGFHSHRVDIKDSTGNLEKSLIDHLNEEDVPKHWLNQGQGLLQNLFFGPHQEYHKLTKDEKMVAATIIQWLGTNCGRWFLRDAFEKAGWKITFESPEDIEANKRKSLF